MLCPDSSSCRDTPRLASSLKEFLIYITTAKRWPLLISASFGPSAVRVITATVYSGRREAGLVMTSLDGETIHIGSIEPGKPAQLRNRKTTRRSVGLVQLVCRFATSHRPRLGPGAAPCR